MKVKNELTKRYKNKRKRFSLRMNFLAGVVNEVNVPQLLQEQWFSLYSIRALIKFIAILLYFYRLQKSHVKLKRINLI